MAFKIILDGDESGAKFATREEAKESLWQLYKDKMSQEEFDQFIEQHLKEV